MPDAPFVPNSSNDDHWHVYIVQCADDTLYTGIAKDVEKRVDEHNNHVLGAKYTRARRPVRLVYEEEWPTRSQAQKREYEIKQLSRDNKITLVRQRSRTT